MSLMSAAEAGQTGGAGPELPVPGRRLRVAAPAAGEEREDRPGSPPDGMTWDAGSGGDRSWSSDAGVRATELHVREVRVVRRASVRTVRASGSRLVPAQAPPGDARPTAAPPWPEQAGPEPGQAGVAAARRTTAAQSRTADCARAAAGGRTATRSRVTARSTTGTQARVVARTRTPVRQPTRRAGPVRLTRRGRLVVAVLAMLLVIVGAMLIWMTAAGSVQASSGGGGSSPYQGMTQVVVRPGQTLWSIAAAAEPSANTWGVVQQIIEINSLNGGTVRAGQQLWVPKA
jgi:nucleoid-associated protein YgaU